MATYKLTPEQAAVCRKLFDLRVEIQDLRQQRQWAVTEYRKANENMVAYQMFIVWADQAQCEKTRRFYSLLRGLRELKTEQSG
jgi:hypothetical protein